MQYSARYAENHFERLLWLRVRSTSKIRELEFNLEPTDIQIPDKCPYLDIPLTRLRGRGNLGTNASVDRIDPTKGYIKGNIQIISRLANMMKQNASLDQLVTFARNVLVKHAP